MQQFNNSTIQQLSNEKGITIYLAMLVMGGALAVALSVSTLMVGEFKISGDTINSLKAVYVADSAMEYALHQARPEGDYTYNGDTGVSTLMVYFPPPTSFGTLYSINMDASLTHPNCPAGLSSDAVCEMKIKLMPKNDSLAPVSCSSSSAQDCTKVIARGSFGGVNRVLEIVYPNL